MTFSLLEKELTDTSLDERGAKKTTTHSKIHHGIGGSLEFSIANSIRLVEKKGGKKGKGEEVHVGYLIILAIKNKGHFPLKAEKKKSLHFCARAFKKEGEGKERRTHKLPVVDLDDRLKLPIYPGKERFIHVYVPIGAGAEEKDVQFDCQGTKLTFELEWGDGHSATREVKLCDITKTSLEETGFFSKSWLAKDSHRNWWYFTGGMNIVSFAVATAALILVL